MSSAQRILIISQTFPPFNGIGGRRWAKFAKYLYARGHHVEVICADLNVKAQSSWSEDVSGIRTYTYAHHFPRVVEQFPKSLYEKLIYRLKLTELKRISKGTPYDRALLDEHSFKELLKSRLEAFEPNSVIVSGAPFYLLHYAIDFKGQFPNSKFVADFRDPWTWGKTYGYSNLTADRSDYEKKLEKRVVHEYDSIFSPWPSIVQKLNELYPRNDHKIYLLEHGYDPDDFKKNGNNTSSPKMDIVFGGTIYAGMEQLLQQVINEFSAEYRFGVYSHDIGKLESVGNTILSKPLPSGEFFEKVSQSRAVLMLVSKHMKDGIPSKLFEYAYQQTPILAIGQRGSLSNFIESNGFGILAEQVEDLKSAFLKLETLKRNEEVLHNYNFEHLTQKLEYFLKNQ